ncbi:MAG: TonB-dependent receptor, partial [Pseudomonadota bacterium]
STRAASVSPTGGTTTTGLNLLDLRGIGASRTLVLVNGRRHVSSSQETAQPDINTIPSALVERVEVLTGGASSVYGADAIAGVVNLVLRKNYEGLEASIRTGVSDEGDGENSTVTITGGFNFGEGRGNLAASFEYAEGEILRYADRDFSAVESTIQIPNPADTDVPGAPPDGIPDFITVRDLRRANISNGGTVNTAAGFFQFDSAGNLVPVDLGTGVVFPGGVTDGGSGLNGLQDETLIPSQDRMSLNLLGHYDVSDQHSLFFEGKYVEIDSDVFSGAPFAPFIVQADNPFLTSQARSVLDSTTPSPFGPPFYVSNRNHRDIGPRGIENERKTFRAVLGLQGELTERTSYEVSYTYGSTDTRSRFLNNAIIPRISLSADAVVDIDGVLGSPGATVCRAQLLAGSTSTGNPDIDDCVAGNYLGDGTVDQAARDYVNVATQARGDLDQHVIGGFITTDSGDYFNLPGGPISFVLGGEYRKEETTFNPDPRDTVGDTVNSGVQAVDGELSVTEWYTEIVAPILAGQPFAELLEFRGSARIADYDLEGVGTNTSWGVGGVYAPNENIRFRASYQEAVRAPNISELFSPQTLSLTTVLDPCSAFGLSLGGEQRAANCASIIPPGTPIPIPTFNLTVTVGGNPQLDVEEGETTTFGLVITPTALPELTLSVDYYDIELSQAIFQANPFTNLTLCYDASSLDNPFCDLIQRDPVTFQLALQSITPINATGFEASGIDLDASYRFDLGASGSLALRLVANKVLDRNDFLDPLDSGLATEVIDTVGNPDWRFTFNASYQVKSFDFGYNVRYFSSQLRTDPANVRSVNGQPPLNPDIFGPEVLRTGGDAIHNLSARYFFSDRGNLYVGIDNVTEPDLPPGIYGAGFGGANYDAVGRYFYAGLNWTFR